MPLCISHWFNFLQNAKYFIVFNVRTKQQYNIYFWIEMIFNRTNVDAIIFFVDFHIYTQKNMYKYCLYKDYHYSILEYGAKWIDPLCLFTNMHLMHSYEKRIHNWSDYNWFTFPSLFLFVYVCLKQKHKGGRNVKRKWKENIDLFGMFSANWILNHWLI